MNANVNPAVSMLESKLTKGGTRTRTTTQVIPRSLARGRRQKLACRCSIPIVKIIQVQVLYHLQPRIILHTHLKSGFLTFLINLIVIEKNCLLGSFTENLVIFRLFWGTLLCFFTPPPPRKLKTKLALPRKKIAADAHG